MLHMCLTPFLPCISYATQATQIYVASSSNHTEPLPTCGNTRQTPCGLAEGISKSQNGDTIILLAGAYRPASKIIITTKDLSLVAEYTHGVTLGSQFRDSSHLNGQPVFIFVNTTATVKGLIFQNFQTNVIIVSGVTSSVQFEDCEWDNIVVMNSMFLNSDYVKFDGVAGLAVYSDSAELSFRNCRFTSIMGGYALTQYAGIAVYVSSTRCLNGIEFKMENCEFQSTPMRFGWLNLIFCSQIILKYRYYNRCIRIERRSSVPESTDSLQHWRVPILPIACFHVKQLLFFYSIGSL
jgi:hypothetical protein